jgi:hypothetical protein
MKYTTLHDRPGSGTYAIDVLIWRAKQLVTAGYGSADIARIVGCTVEIADAAFLEAYPEVGQ